MEVDFVKQLKSVDDDYKLFVHGYIREVFIEQLKISNIPSSIIDLCIVFSYLLFEWDLQTMGAYMEANEETLLVHHTKDEGSNICSKTILDANAIYIFKIKVFLHAFGLFGITNADQFANKLKWYCFALDAEDGYGCGGSSGWKYKSDRRQHALYASKPEDLVEMTFDKTKGTLSYKVDGTDYGIAWANIDIDKDYKFAAYMWSKSESFQVIDFEIKWP